MPSVAYRVCPALPHEHLFEVEARFPTSGPELIVWLPVWTPGSYLVREFARHLQDLQALDPTGAPRSVRRLDKNRWRVETRGASEIRVRYRVYANEPTVRTSHLDASHGYFNGANLLVTSDAHRFQPCALSVDALPRGWRVFCALPEREGAFHAADYDELIDSPVEMGPHAALRFTAADKPHEVVLWGQGNYDPERLTRDLARICETEAALFGGLPFERYLFIVHLTDKGRGGLEHAASTSLLHPRFGFQPQKSYEDFLSLAAHEYFHLWNVKRIKPRALVPVEYGRECYTSLLWAMEGLTSYYDTLLLRRAGLIDARRYLERVGEAVTTLESAPGRRALSLADASFLAWIKHYRPDENTPNSAISYYVKGEVVALLLDLHLREATGGMRSLDDLMRLLFKRYGEGQGVPEEGVEEAACELGGPGLRAFFDRAVRSTEELDYGILASAGLSLGRRAKKGPGDKGGTAEGGEDDKSWLGVDLKPGDKAIVATAYTGSPAAQHGLYADDEIVALDGFRVSGASLQDRLNERRPGERVRLALFRRDQLLELDFTLGARPKTACWFVREPGASAAQRGRFQEWLGEPFEEKPAPR